MSKRVIIVGAGPGGLASAMLLAKAGVDVTVIEKRSTVGGRTSTLEQDGYRFDLGPTFFLYPQVLKEIFKAAGRELEHEIEMIRLDPQYRLIFEDGPALDATPNVERMKREIAKLNADDANHFERFLTDNRAKLAGFKPILESNWSSPLGLMQYSPFKMMPLVRPWSSVDGNLKRYFSDPRVRLAFSFQSKYLGMSPFKCPSLFTILSFLEYEHGIFHPKGGCGAVSQVMARIAQEMGVKVHLNEPVEEILFDGRRATAVRTANETYHADALVLNADFAHAMSQLVPESRRRKYTDTKLARKKYSCSTFMLYLGIEGQCDEIAHHNIFLASNYQENIRDIEDTHRLSDNPSVYVQNPCVTDPTMTKPGHTSLYVLVPVSHEHGNIDWECDAQAFREKTLDQIQKIGLPDLRGRIRYEKMITPRDWRMNMAIYRGATFNLAHNLTQMLHLRPQNRFEEFDGMYLVGGGTHPGSGLPVIYESARISSRLLLTDLGIRENWPLSEKSQRSGQTSLDMELQPAANA